MTEAKILARELSPAMGEPQDPRANVVDLASRQRSAAKPRLTPFADGAAFRVRVVLADQAG